jgi:excisionase family DNA binding protein
MTGNVTHISKAKSSLLTRTEAAEYLGVTPQTLAVWACTRRYNLPVVKMGRLAKYKLSDLDEFINSRSVGGIAA